MGRSFLGDAMVIHSFIGFAVTIRYTLKVKVKGSTEWEWAALQKSDEHQRQQRRQGQAAASYFKGQRALASFSYLLLISVSSR